MEIESGTDLESAMDNESSRDGKSKAIEQTAAAEAQTAAEQVAAEMAEGRAVVEAAAGKGGIQANDSCCYRESRAVNRGDDRKYEHWRKARFKEARGRRNGSAGSGGTVSMTLGSAPSSCLSRFVSPVCAASTNSSAIFSDAKLA